MKRLSLFFCCCLMICQAARTQSDIPLWKTAPTPPPMPVADRSGFAPVNDIKLYYAIFNATGKDPVILLHGGLVSSDYWSFEVPLLAKTHEVIIVDNRGHGRSSLSAKPITYDLMASDILQLIDYLKLEKVSIAGWSDGGVIGLLIAIHHPEKLRRLFAFGTNFNLSGYSTETGDSVMSARFMTQATANYRHVSPTPDSFIVLKKALRNLYGAEPNIDSAAIRTIRVPTVIAYAQYDQFITRAHFIQLGNLIPGARLVMLPNVSHGAPLQDPVLFHNAVMEWLSRD